MQEISFQLDTQLASIQRCLADCQEMHRTIQQIFGCSRQHGNILFRCWDQDLLVRTERPIGAQPPGFHLVGQHYLAIPPAGSCMQFSIICYPSVCWPDQPRRYIRNAEERQIWLRRKAGAAGFTLLSIREQGELCIRGEKPDGRISLRAATFIGLLQVVDTEKFAAALRDGIGAGKAYGLGLLEIGFAAYPLPATAFAG